MDVDVPMSPDLKEGPREDNSPKDYPQIEQKKRRIILNHKQICKLKNIIEDMYDDMEIPTVMKIMDRARTDLNFDGSRARLRSILRNQLGYKFNKRHRDVNTLLERESLKERRFNYLKRIRDNESLGDKKKPIVYVGEFLITVPSKNKPARIKKHPRKWMLFYAGTEKGFIGKEILYKFRMCKGKPKSKDFVRYVKDNIVPHLPMNSIVVMGYSFWHNMQMDPVPTWTSTPEYMQKWMMNHKIPFEQHLPKEKLLELINNTRPKKKYVVDELLSRHGHEALRVPPFHVDLNPIEYINMIIKTYLLQEMAAGNVVSEDLFRRVIMMISDNDWTEQVANVKNVEKRYWVRDVDKEEDFISLFSNAKLMSDSESDSNTDYDYQGSSNSSENGGDNESDWTDIE